MRMGLGLWVSVTHNWLDWLLAHGEDPSASRSLALRARQLTSRKTREKLSTSIDEVLRSPGILRRFSAAIPADPSCVAVVRPDLEEISAILRDQAPVFARGVAMTAALLNEWESPLFDPTRSWTAGDQVRRTVRALEGHI